MAILGRLSYKLHSIFNKHTLLCEKDTGLFKDLKKGDIAIDCGANIGKVTEEMAQNGATVYAFEPNPVAYDALCKRIKKYRNVICFNKGVLDKNITLKLYKHVNASEDELYWSQGSSIISSKRNITTKDFYEVEIIDLCEFISSLNSRVKLLKIDIEGAECELLDKMIKKDIYKLVDLTVVETHDDKIPELKEKTDKIRRMLKEKGINNILLNWK